MVELDLALAFISNSITIISIFTAVNVVIFSLVYEEKSRKEDFKIFALYLIFTAITLATLLQLLIPVGGYIKNNFQFGAGVMLVFLYIVCSLWFFGRISFKSFNGKED